jgi:hypothetical protein
MTRPTPEYVPGAHLTHVVATLDAPALVEYVPATQFTHVATDDAPAAVEYVPATHC